MKHYIRRLHLLHIIALVALFCMGVYWLGVIEMANRVAVMDDLPIIDMELANNRASRLATTRLAAFAGMVVFSFSAVVGWQVSLSKKVLGIVWLLAGAAGVVWMLLMWNSPTHISLIEVFPFWIVCIILGIIASVYSLMTWRAPDSARSTAYGGDDLLDD